MIRDDVPFRIVVEPQEHDEYAARFGAERMITLPWSDLGKEGLIAARNWIKQHSIEEGHARHWQIDDNIVQTRRLFHGKKIPCDANYAFSIAEDFVDRYENIAIAGLNYSMFAYPVDRVPPFFLNSRVYSCTLVLNEIPHRWRTALNDDTDICLQVLADGWCTVLINAFLVQKLKTMSVAGGNTPHYTQDGRLRMAKSLERNWPGVVTTRRRFGRPQHWVKGHWTRFDTPLKLKPEIDLEAMEKIDNYGLELHKVRDEIKSEELRELYEQHGNE